MVDGGHIGELRILCRPQQPSSREHDISGCSSPVELVGREMLLLHQQIRTAQTSDPKCPARSAAVFPPLDVVEGHDRQRWFVCCSS